MDKAKDAPLYGNLEDLYYFVPPHDVDFNYIVMESSVFDIVTTEGGALLIVE